MTVLFKNLRAIGYGEHTRSLHRNHGERGWPRLRHSTPTLSFISHSTHLGQWRARDRGLFRQPILTPDTTSVVYHLACQSGLTVPRSFLYCLFPGSTLIHYRRTPQSIVRSLPPRVSPPRPRFSPLRPLMHRII
jgi:hypothetical protein